MVQSVELLIDETSENLIRRQWDLLAAAGVAAPRSGSAPGADPERHRPHITVGVAREMWPHMDRQLAELPFRPLPIRLGGVLVFGARRPILVRAVVPSEQLLAWQRQVYRVVAPCPGIPANLRPDQWTPHITLARRVPTARIGEAIVAVASDRDLAATVIGMRRWDGENRRAWDVTGSG